MSSLQDKVRSTISVIRPVPQFIETLSQKLPISKDFDSEDKDLLVEEWVWRRLEKLGIYNDDSSNDILMSDDCQEGDARRYFCENGEPNLPVARFKRVWSILKGPVKEIPSKTSTSSNSDIKELVNAVRPIGQYSDDELLDHYDLECADAIVNELNKRAHGRHFIVFKDKTSGAIDPALSRKFLKVARHKDTPDHIIVDDIFYQLYKAGQFPHAVYEECPLHPGVLLTEGYCDQCQSSWSNVQEEARTFVRVMKNEGDAPTTSRFDIRKLIEEASGSDGMANLKQHSPLTAVKFEELKEEGRLPSLKSRSSEPTKIQDPFGSRRY